MLAEVAVLVIAASVGVSLLLASQSRQMGQVSISGRVSNEFYYSVYPIDAWPTWFCQFGSAQEIMEETSELSR